MSSVPAAISRPATTASPVRARARNERRFFTGMALMMALACFAGFAPSYFLKSHFGTPPLKPLLHFHGLVFTLWMVLLVVQSSLIAAGRVKLHRQLGIAGAVLAVLMVVSAVAVTLARGKTVTPGVPHEQVLSFLAIPFVALLLFPSLIGSALYFRRDAGTHKRLMLLATTVFLSAAVHRLLMWLVDPAVSPPVFFGATDLFIVALAMYDISSHGRLHPATLWGGLLILVGQLSTVLLAGSQTWLTFAHWITKT